MSDTHVTAHVPTSHGATYTPTAAAPFSPEEQAAFQQDDIEAGANVVKLMLGIFAIGIILYSVVALIVAG